VNDKDRRLHQRVPLNCSGVIQVGKAPEAATYIIDISEGGLRCLFQQSVPLGSAAELRFVLPVATGMECVVAGRVQHHHRINESYQLGIELTRASEEVRHAIREFVRQTQEAGKSKA
jgi:c-di-GMP-binding flagellar brake protein YcgR